MNNPKEQFTGLSMLIMRPDGSRQEIEIDPESGYLVEIRRAAEGLRAGGNLFIYQFPKDPAKWAFRYIGPSRRTLCPECGAMVTFRESRNHSGNFFGQCESCLTRFYTMELQGLPLLLKGTAGPQRG